MGFKQLDPGPDGGEGPGDQEEHSVGTEEYTGDGAGESCDEEGVGFRHDRSII